MSRGARGIREPAPDLRTAGRGSWWPWVVAAAILALLLWRTPLDELALALRRGPAVGLALFAAFAMLAAFAADLWATGISVTTLGVRLSRAELVVVRGTSHLLGLLNFTLGQGTIGYYLARRGIAASRATGVVAYLVVVSFLGLTVLAMFGLALGPSLGATATASLLATGGIALLAPTALYVARPRWLRRRAFAEAIFSAPPARHAAALASRVLHFGAFTVLYWGALRVWGVPVPLSTAVGLIAILLFVAALPITPYGMGTVQAAQILLLSPFMPQADPAAREASVLAFGLIHFAASAATQALLGFVCYLGWRRLSRRPPTAPPHPTAAG